MLPFVKQVAWLFAICLHLYVEVALAAPEKLGTCYDVANQCTHGSSSQNGKRDIFGNLSDPTTIYGNNAPPCRAFRSISARDLNVCQCTVPAGCRSCQRVNLEGCVDVSGSDGPDDQYYSLAPA
ncbi:unnamed protein product [Parajaminaea phylloscopi]